MAPIVPHRSLLQELEEQEDSKESHEQPAITSGATAIDSSLRHRRGGLICAAISKPEFQPESGHLEPRFEVGRAARAATSPLPWSASFLTLLALVLLAWLFPARICGMAHEQ
jgi:hypothetical protein